MQQLSKNSCTLCHLTIKCDSRENLIMSTEHSVFDKKSIATLMDLGIGNVWNGAVGLGLKCI